MVVAAIRGWVEPLVVAARSARSFPPEIGFMRATYIESPNRLTEVSRALRGGRSAFSCSGVVANRPKGGEKVMIFWNNKDDTPVDPVVVPTSIPDSERVLSQHYEHRETTDVVSEQRMLNAVVDSNSP